MQKISAWFCGAAWSARLPAGIAIGVIVLPIASAQTLQLRVVSNGQATIQAGNSEVVPIQVQVQLGGAANDGLAQVGFNLTATGGFDLCDQSQFLLTAPVSLAPHFDRNGGMTNPPGGPISGFSGTCDGAGGLWQLGGGQNVFGSADVFVSYPSGTVLEGVGNSGWVTLAGGTLTTPAAGNHNIVISANTVFANVLKLGQTGPRYDVVEVVPAGIAVVGALTVTAFVQQYLDEDVNCDAHINSGDLLAVRAPGIWQSTGPAGWIRADVNDDGVVNSGDLLAIRAPGTWQTTYDFPSGPCVP